MIGIFEDSSSIHSKNKSYGRQSTFFLLINPRYFSYFHFQSTWFPLKKFSCSEEFPFFSESNYRKWTGTVCGTGHIKYIRLWIDCWRSELILCMSWCPNCWWTNRSAFRWTGICHTMCYFYYYSSGDYVPPWFMKIFKFYSIQP